MGDMSWSDWTFVAIVLVIVFLPAQYDPAIFLRKWINKGRSRWDAS